MAVLSKVTKCINLDLIDNYLNKCNNYRNKCKKVQRNNSFSTVHELKHRVQQGSIIVSLIFKTHIYNLFCFIDVWETASYVDDTKPYPTCKHSWCNIFTWSLLSLFKKEKTFSWFDDNYMEGDRENHSPNPAPPLCPP